MSPSSHRVASPIVMTLEQEIWGMALWVEKHHETDGHGFIADRIASLEADGEHGGANLWRGVEKRYSQLRIGLIPIHGQPETQPN